MIIIEDGCWETLGPWQMPSDNTPIGRYHFLGRDDGLVTLRYFEVL